VSTALFGVPAARRPWSVPAGTRRGTRAAPHPGGLPACLLRAFSQPAPPRTRRPAASRARSR